jgi:hypothetical protein
MPRKSEILFLMRARGWPLSGAASAATKVQGRVCGQKMRVRWRYRMAETLGGSGRLSRLATGPGLFRGTRPEVFARRRGRLGSFEIPVRAPKAGLAELAQGRAIKPCKML